MPHTFQLTFMSGDVLTLAVDMTSFPATLARSSEDLPSRFPAEYGMWVHEVVVPGLLELASKEQRIALAKRGLKTLAQAAAAEETT